MVPRGGHPGLAQSSPAVIPAHTPQAAILLTEMVEPVLGDDRRPRQVFALGGVETANG
jgi:hypothetical protein